MLINSDAMMDESRLLKRLEAEMRSVTEELSSICSRMNVDNDETAQIRQSLMRQIRDLWAEVEYAMSLASSLQTASERYQQIEQSLADIAVAQDGSVFTGRPVRDINLIPGSDSPMSSGVISSVVTLVGGIIRDEKMDLPDWIGVENGRIPSKGENFEDKLPGIAQPSHSGSTVSDEETADAPSSTPIQPGLSDSTSMDEKKEELSESVESAASAFVGGQKGELPEQDQKGSNSSRFINSTAVRRDNESGLGNVDQDPSSFRGSMSGSPKQDSGDGSWDNLELGQIISAEINTNVNGSGENVVPIDLSDTGSVAVGVPAGQEKIGIWEMPELQRDLISQTINQLRSISFGETINGEKLISRFMELIKGNDFSILFGGTAVISIISAIMNKSEDDSEEKNALQKLVDQWKAFVQVNDEDISEELDDSGLNGSEHGEQTGIRDDWNETSLDRVEGSIAEDDSSNPFGENSEIENMENTEFDPSELEDDDAALNTVEETELDPSLLEDEDALNTVEEMEFDPDELYEDSLDSEENSAFDSEIDEDVKEIEQSEVFVKDEPIFSNAKEKTHFDPTSGVGNLQSSSDVGELDIEKLPSFPISESSPISTGDSSFTSQEIPYFSSNDFNLSDANVQGITEQTHTAPDFELTGEQTDNNDSNGIPLTVEQQVAAGIGSFGGVTLLSSTDLLEEVAKKSKKKRRHRKR